MASVRPGWSSCLLAQASLLAIHGGCLTWTAEPKRHPGKVAIVLVDNTGLARGRGASHLKHWFPIFACWNMRPDIGAAVAADLTSEFRLKIGKPDVIGPKLRADHDRMCARVSGHLFQDVFVENGFARTP